MKTTTRLVGDTVSGERSKDDFYPTPAWATLELLKREQFSGNVWEPACGDGAISKVLIEQGFEVFSSDLVFRGFDCAILDFLGPCEKTASNIITNPPFALSVEFIEQSKKVATSKIAMFLKTRALEGKRRFQMWLDKDFPFARMYQFVERVGFGREAGTHKSGGMIAFAWFVWDKSHQGPPTIHWIADSQKPAKPKPSVNQISIF